MTADTLMILSMALGMVAYACAVAALGIVLWLAWERWRDWRADRLIGRYS